MDELTERKCPCCGSSNLELYLETGTSSHYVCLDCRHGYEEQKLNKLKTILDGILKKMKSGEKLTQDDIELISKEMSEKDFMWITALFAFISAFQCENYSADYWRGKYDAYIEMLEKE